MKQLTRGFLLAKERLRLRLRNASDALCVLLALREKQLLLCSTAAVHSRTREAEARGHSTSSAPEPSLSSLPPHAPLHSALHPATTGLRGVRMGNCLKIVSSNSDDISLLRESPSRREADLTSDLSSPPPPYQPATEAPAAHVRRVASQLTEEEQVRVAQRMGLIQHLPTGAYDGSKKSRECVICMNDFLVGETIRFLPCMHVYHTVCIDDWLLRGSFTCPSCMEPVDAALLSSYQTD